MGLALGSKLGPYEIQSALGAGGMGEVYRALDTRLERTVAIKILPSYLSENSEAKQRFFPVPRPMCLSRLLPVATVPRFRQYSTVRGNLSRPRHRWCEFGPEGFETGIRSTPASDLQCNA
jgi:serine/threonine protein kinase